MDRIQWEWDGKESEWEYEASEQTISQFLAKASRFSEAKILLLWAFKGAFL